MDQFKACLGINFKQVYGESATVNNEYVVSWKINVLLQLVKNFSSINIYNMGEFGIFLQNDAKKINSYKRRNMLWVILSKDHLAVLLNANSDGSDKLRLLVIGKSCNPQCFKNVKYLPFLWKSAQSMDDRQTFSTWVHNF